MLCQTVQKGTQVMTTTMVPIKTKQEVLKMMKDALMNQM